MAHAYYIALHHKPYQFHWLFDALHTEDDLFLVHIDRSAAPAVQRQVRAIIAGRNNVVLLPAVNISWGGWSQVATELKAMTIAREHRIDWHYFINLSGQDYPLQPVAQIRHRLEHALPGNFIRVVPFDDLRKSEPDDPHLRKRAALEMFGRVTRLPFRWPAPRGLDTDFKGSQWHMLTREFCDWVCTDPMARRLARRMRFARIPDEIFFPALIMNSPFRDTRMRDCGRLFLFPGPKTLDIGDLDAIAASDDFFARKFDAAVDRQVLEAIARRCGFRVPTRAW